MSSTSSVSIRFARSLALALLSLTATCAGPVTSGGTGGGTSAPKGGAGGGGNSGGAAGSSASGGAGGGTSSTGGSGGAGGTGGSSQPGTGTGGSAGSSGSSATGGAAGSSGTGGTGGTPSTVTVPDLPPPNPCSNHFTTSGCRKGQAASTCGGVCSNDYGGTAANVCAGGGGGIPTNYACPQWILYSDALNAAAAADGYGGKFNYGVVGHDSDTGGIDSGIPDSCCQCYQLVFDYPQEDQCWDNHKTGTSAVTIPKPVIVQGFNTAAGGGKNFDIYMGGGGFGANNGCYVNGGTCPGGPCMYSGYPTQDGGMVKAVGTTFNNPSPCKNKDNLVSQDTLTSAACVDAVTNMCSKITSPTAGLATQAVRSCIQSNGVTKDESGQIPGNYHINWYVMAKRVECPASLTKVTGCKLADQKLPSPDPNVATAAQAKTAGFAAQYTTTQMQDCCMPTCSWADNVKGPTVNGYNSFYSCDNTGVPWTTAVTRTK